VLGLLFAGLWHALLTHRSPSSAGIDDYVACVKRVDRSLDKLTSSKMRVQQQTIGDYNELLSEGLAQLLDVFASMLSDRLQPVEPLHFITKRKNNTTILIFAAYTKQSWHSLPSHKTDCHNFMPSTEQSPHQTLVVFP